MLAVSSISITNDTRPLYSMGGRPPAALKAYAPAEEEPVVKFQLELVATGDDAKQVGLAYYLSRGEQQEAMCFLARALDFWLRAREKDVVVEEGPADD